MSNDFIITPKDEATIQLSIRIERRIQEGLDELAKRSGRSRNELINSALSYALENAKFIDKNDSV